MKGNKGLCKKLFLVVFGLLILVNNSVIAQEKTPVKQDSKLFVLGVTDEIISKELSETRKLNIYLPEGYDTGSIRYPVIYLLDGSGNEDFIHVVGIVQFLTMIEAMPKSIVVGIANIDRRRDFTFPTKIDSDRIAYPTTGHSDKFISFIRKELEPYVQSNYRTNSSKTIIGQSLGGLLATEILFEAPTLFNNYIIVSPSLWWDKESLIANTQQYVRNLPKGHINVYVCVGNEGKQMEDDATSLTDKLRELEGWDLRICLSVLPEENHLTILHNAAYKALGWLNTRH